MSGGVDGGEIGVEVDIVGCCDFGSGGGLI